MGRGQSNARDILLGKSKTTINRVHKEKKQEETRTRRDTVALDLNGPKDWLEAYAEGKITGETFRQGDPGDIIVAKGHLLSDTSSASNKEYQGVIVIGKHPLTNQVCLKGYCTYGPGGKGMPQKKMWSSGNSLPSVCAEVKDMVEKKMKKNYTVKQAQQMQTSYTGLDPQEVEAVAKTSLKAV